MDQQFQGRRRKRRHTYDAPDSDDEEKNEGDVMDDIPSAVRYQEMRELTKLRYVLRRRKKAQPRTGWQKLLRWYIYPAVEEIIIVLCLWLPNVYKERHRKLSYAVFEPDTWPNMFTERRARKRAALAWRSYMNSLVDEWNSSNVITALILSAAGALLAVPGIPLPTYYACIITLLSSLASIAHASYHSHFYRQLIDDAHWNMLQLRCYLSCYRPIMGFLLCQPLLNLFYAIAAFSIGILAYLWPYNPPDGPDPPPIWAPPLAAKIAITALYVVQLSLIALSYKWNRSAFFTTNELLVGEGGRYARVLADEEHRAQEILAELDADQAIADGIPVFEIKPKGFSTAALARSAMVPVATASPHTVITPREAVQEPAFSPLVLPVPQVMEPTQWLRATMADIPDEALPLGYDRAAERGQFYAARMFYEGRWRVGKAGRHILAHIPYRGQEVGTMLDYDVLCGDPANCAWLLVPEGSSFDSAVHLPSGYRLMTADDSKDGRVYIASAMRNGARHIGEVLDGATAASIPSSRREVFVTPFYVLLVKD